MNDTGVGGGHFFVAIPPVSAMPQAVKASKFSLSTWLNASLLRFKEEAH